MSLQVDTDCPADPIAGRRVAITGGTAGLGLALVNEFVTRGASVAFVARNRAGVERVASEHPRTHGIVGDISRKGDIYPIAHADYRRVRRVGYTD